VALSGTLTLTISTMCWHYNECPAASLTWIMRANWRHNKTSGGENNKSEKPGEGATPRPFTATTTLANSEKAGKKEVTTLLR
jgi:hypothetical protein